VAALQFHPRTPEPRAFLGPRRILLAPPVCRGRQLCSCCRSSFRAHALAHSSPHSCPSFTLLPNPWPRPCCSSARACAGPTPALAHAVAPPRPNHSRACRQPRLQRPPRPFRRCRASAPSRTISVRVTLHCAQHFSSRAYYAWIGASPPVRTLPPAHPRCFALPKPSPFEPSFVPVSAVSACPRLGAPRSARHPSQRRLLLGLHALRSPAPAMVRTSRCPCRLRVPGRCRGPPAEPPALACPASAYACACATQCRPSLRAEPRHRSLQTRACRPSVVRARPLLSLAPAARRPQHLAWARRSLRSASALLPRPPPARAALPPPACRTRLAEPRGRALQPAA
jgi:hypothetical protein